MPLGQNNLQHNIHTHKTIPCCGTNFPQQEVGVEVKLREALRRYYSMHKYTFFFSSV